MLRQIVQQLHEKLLCNPPIAGSIDGRLAPVVLHVLLEKDDREKLQLPAILWVDYLVDDHTEVHVGRVLLSNGNNLLLGLVHRPRVFAAMDRLQQVVESVSVHLIWGVARARGTRCTGHRTGRPHKRSRLIHYLLNPRLHPVLILLRTVLVLPLAQLQPAALLPVLVLEEGQKRLFQLIDGGVDVQ